MLRLARNVPALEDLGLEVVGFGAIFVVRASQKGCCWDLRTDNNDWVGPVFRGTDDNFRNETLVWVIM